MKRKKRLNHSTSVRKIRFIISVVHINGDIRFVDGRCAGNTIQISDRFTNVATYIGDDEKGESSYVSQIQVDLEIVKVFTYGKYVKKLEHGMTGRLYLAGEHTLLLQQNDILIN